MERLFLVVMGIYLAHSLWTNRYPEEATAQRSRVKIYGIQGPLFVLACMLAWDEGAAGRGLFSLPHIVAGLFIGHFVFGLSLLATHRNLKDTLQVLVDLPSLWRFFVETPGLFFRFLLVSISEELIYRVALQGSLYALVPGPVLGPVLAIGLTAAAFSVVHWHFFRNRLLDSAEFVAFALLLGLAYWWWESLILVVVIHTMRNLEIVYLEYMRYVVEKGSEAAAMETIEERYFHGRTRAS